MAEASEARRKVIRRLADELEARRQRQGHPLRAGLDGRSNAGKSHLAEELVAELSRRQRPALRVSLDEFHRKGHKFRAGTWTFETRLAEGLDYDVFRAWVLEPLGPGGSRRIRPRLLDSYNDEFWPEAWLQVRYNAIVVCDAGHGFVPDIVGLWDYRIWLEVSTETMVSRATSRDIAWAGSREDVRRRYETFWTPMDAYYQAKHDPVSRAHCVVDNNDFDAPVILRI